MIDRAQTEVDRFLTRSPWLDRLGEGLQQLVRQAFTSSGEPGLRVRNFLNGVWLGHPLHAALTDVPVGAWTTGFFLDYLGAISGSRSLKRAGDWATGFGVLGAVFAALAGLADYSEVESEPRRYGTVHAALNAAALGAYVMSLMRRLAGDRAGALPLSTIGYGLTFISAEVGGTMVYKYGALVNRVAWLRGPDDFHWVMPSSDLVEGQMRSAEVRGTRVLLARAHGQIYAIGDVCTHWGCTLSEGHLEGTVVECPCHGSRFDVETGAVVGGPASVPEPTFEVRERSHQIELRMRAY
jgi:nitrite reductase/ring-hydroxylating ferredoxin subunit/uncharacterized membrane protein